jgi:hypothetical protein
MAPVRRLWPRIIDACAMADGEGAVIRAGAGLSVRGRGNRIRVAASAYPFEI